MIGECGKDSRNEESGLKLGLVASFTQLTSFPTDTASAMESFGALRPPCALTALVIKRLFPDGFEVVLSNVLKRFL